MIQLFYQTHYSKLKSYYTELKMQQEKLDSTLNESKTEYIRYNIDNSILKTVDDKILKQVDDFLYLGSWINSCNKEIGKAWTALQKMDIIWKSNMSTPLKVAFFKSTIESFLLYGSSSWTLTQSLIKRIDGAYTKMLRVANGIVICKEQRTRFSGHCWRSKE